MEELVDVCLHPGVDRLALVDEPLAERSSCVDGAL